ncbi:MAG: SNF2-related protein, partial [Planctomycetes bacterium]|nr:SNF2-related protein [Planctomycetota bacterium]
GRGLGGRAPRRAPPLLAHLQRRPLVVPRAEGAAVLVRLAQLERVVPLQVPPGAAGPVVDADARPRLVLEPRGRLEDGLRASLRVRPLDLAREGEAAPADPGPPAVPGEGRAELLCLAGGGLARARRDLAAEVERAEVLAAALGLADREPAGPWAWELDLAASLALLEAAPATGAPVEWPEGERLRVSREVGLSSFHVAVRDARSWFQLDGALEVDGERIELALVLNALRGGERHVALGDGRFLRLSAALRERLEALRGAVTERRGKLELDVTAAPVVAPALDGVAEADLSRSWREVLARLDAARRVSVRVPRGLRAELRGYQREGWAWLKRLSTFGAGACLADDMGLGKTVQAIAALLDRAPLGPALVVAPTSVGPNWVREVERFAPSLRPRLLRDTDRDAGALAALGPKDVLVASYDLARIDAALLQGVGWATLVLDEAQRVKNARTLTAEALAGLDAGWRLALTGTPVENRLSDLWSLFRIVSPGLLGSWEGFRERFAAPIERDRDPERAQALARLLRPYVLRRTKEQVLTELPPRSESTLDVNLSRGERALYEDARLEAVARLERLVEAGDRDARFHVLAALTRLRQLACHPGLVEASWRGPSAKLTQLLEVVRDLVQGGHRALVFSQFTAHLALVRAALDREGLAYHYLDGRTPTRARQAEIDGFQRGERPLFLVSLKAGGVGLNLTGADYVLHLDPWWNPAVEDQATGRAHRLGQRRPVTVYRLVARGTIEEQILALHADKRALVAAVLDGSDRAGALSTSELVALIRGEGAAPRAPATPPRESPPARAVAPPPSVDDVAALRAYLGLTQRQLGELVGAAQPTVSQWERGTQSPRPEARARLERLVSRPPAELVAATGAARRRAAR